MTSPFGLEPEDFWSDPRRTASALHTRFAVGQEYGVFLDAPPEVDLEERRTVPLLVAYSEEEGVAADVDLQGEGKLVLARASDRHVEVSSPLERPRRGSEDRASIQPIFELHVVDLAQKFRLRAPETYDVLMLLRDRLLARARFVTKRTPRGYQDPEVQAYLERLRAAPPPPAPATPAGDPYPAFTRGGDGVPAEPGLTVSVERVVPLREGATCPLTVAYRLPVLRGDRVPGDPPAAVLPLALLVVGSVDPGARLLRLRAPARGPFEGDVATGQVVVDLLADPELRRPQTLFVTALCGSLSSGPHPVGLVVVADGLA